jgi:hypothetical protein
VEFCQNEKYKHRKGILNEYCHNIPFSGKKNHQISRMFLKLGSNFNWLHFLTSGHLMLNPSQKLAMTQQNNHWSHHIIEI